MSLKAVVVASLCGAALANGASPNCKSTNFPGAREDPEDSTRQILDLGDGITAKSMVPPAAPCYQEWGYDKEKCANVEANWLSHTWHANSPSSVMWNQFTRDSCLPPNLPLLPPGTVKPTCPATGYPKFILTAKTAEDVVAAVRYANANNVAINVKNTGHDYFGRSNVPGSLSVWTHGMKNIKFKPNFKPRKCKKTYKNLVEIEAGVQMEDLYKYLAEKKGLPGGKPRTFVGGNGKTVGVVGYTLGGGHSILSSKYGLGSDQVVQIKVVRPDGKLVIANRCQNHKLFWALRGGGGGTFGIVTSMTIKTYRMPKIAAVRFFMNVKSTKVEGDLADVDKQLVEASDEETKNKLTEKKNDLQKKISGYTSFAAATAWTHLPELVDNDLNGYLYASSKFFMKGMQKPIPMVAGSLVMIARERGKSVSTAYVEEKIAELKQKISEALKGYKDVEDVDVHLMGAPFHVSSEYKTVLDYIESFDMPNPAGRNAWLGSRLLSSKALSSGFDLLQQSTRTSFMPPYPMAGIGALVVGGKALDNSTRGASTSANPGWEKAYASMFTSVNFLPQDQASSMRAQGLVNAILTPLRQLDPESGAYGNEAFPFEPKWQTAFWGSNYKKLLARKEKIDPKSVFWCPLCVGSEGWEVKTENGIPTLCKVASQDPAAKLSAEDKVEAEEEVTEGIEADAEEMEVEVGTEGEAEEEEE